MIVTSADVSTSYAKITSSLPDLVLTSNQPSAILTYRARAKVFTKDAFFSYSALSSGMSHTSLSGNAHTSVCI